MKKFLIVTGGSGGHVMPALSIFDHLKKNFQLFLLTDKRGSKYIDKDRYNLNIIDVPNLFEKFYLIPLNLIKFLIAIFYSFIFLKRNKINFLISTGGYMSVPICLASKIIGIKIFLVEPNSVLGRANSFILSLSSKIICYDKNIKNYPKKYENKIRLINPILREEIYKSKKNDKNEMTDLKKILVLGGSQGAKFFDKNITELLLKVSQQVKIEINQQVYDDDEKKLIKKKYNDLKISNILFNFDEKLHNKVGEFDLAITRSGASTIAEFAFFNVPFIAIPFPFAKDDHQYFNAKFYDRLDSCWLIRQEDFKINIISNLIIKLFNEKNEYFIKKDNLKRISKENTWNYINKRLMEIIHEN